MICGESEMIETHDPKMTLSGCYHVDDGDEARRRHAAGGRPEHISHLVRHPEGQLVVLSHDRIATCDYCTTQGDCRGRPDVPEVPWSDTANRSVRIPTPPRTMRW